MKITGVKTLFADGGHRVLVFVKVETDRPGLVGWGEASLEAKPRAVDGYILPPTKPGTGVEVDETAVSKHQPDFSTEKVRQQIAWFREYHPDGNVADW